MWPQRCLLGALLLAGCAYVSVSGAPTPPVWPEAFEVQYTFSIPYISSVQATPFKYPVHIWYNSTATLLRASFASGLDDVFVTKEANYFLYPRITKRACMVVRAPVGPTVGKTVAVGEDPAIPNPLPDISGWTYGGPSSLPGRGPTHTWVFTMRVFEKVASYTFHVSQKDKAPMRLDMLGVNLLTGSHFDQYVVDFDLYVPTLPPGDRPFRPPDALCDKAHVMTGQEAHGHTLGQTLSLLPSQLVPTGPASTRATHTDVLSTLRRYWNQLHNTLTHTLRPTHQPTSDTPTPTDANESDLDVTQRNLQLIQQWIDAREKTIIQESQQGQQQASVVAASRQGPVAAQDMVKLSVNKFVTWDEQRWKATMTGQRPRSSGKGSLSAALKRSKAYLGEFKRTLPDNKLPQSVDWRGTGADGPVKDQASCGSCWAFATTGAMTGAWFLATNQSLSFSEQQLVDCSWDYVCPDGGCGGCWGGNSEPALEYLADHGGTVLEAAYPYKGLNSVCRDKSTRKAARFKGYKNVPMKDERAMMEAVATHGPISISFDAVHPTFKFYSEGVYYREDCYNDPDHLNHAVVLVGYGTTPSGTDYWLLRNSWSQYWGDGGYFKMARKGNDCGVTVDGVIAIVDEKAADRARNGLEIE